MVRVLQVYPQMNNAGTERVIFNLYENIDTSLVQFDFLVTRPGKMDEKIRSMGGKIYYLDDVSILGYYKRLISFFNSHPEYRVVHTHTHGRMGVVLKAAQKSGITCRIAHSHNARNDLPKVMAIFKGLTCIPIELSATHFFACSSNAAKWLFPHRANKCVVLYNGIKLDDYLFCAENRKIVRNQLKLSEDDFAMIHVGRFAKQKNHEFLVQILRSYSKKNTSNWKMLLVGEGPLEGMIKKDAEDAGLSDHILFLGSRNDVNQLYSAADMFLFPSLHEGLGIVVIEAQASGLPCVVSDAIPSEADMKLKLITTLRLQQSPEEWADAINAQMKKPWRRDTLTKSVLNSEYNITRIAAQMQQFYLENGK